MAGRVPDLRFRVDGGAGGHLQDALAQAGIAENRPYPDTCLVAIADRDVLAAWRDLACATPVHALFEQNAFNLLVHAGRCPAILAPVARWAIHGPSLAMAAPRMAGSR